MPILNIMCPICTEVFKNADDIYSTSCGHIFHLTCMSDWQRRGTSCPQCRQFNPTTHKLYLSFDDSEESSKKVQEIELKLKSSNEKYAELLNQVNETEENFLHLQGQYTESSELVKELQDQIQLLSIENECITKELRFKCLQIDTLKARLGTDIIIIDLENETISNQ